MTDNQKEKQRDIFPLYESVVPVHPLPDVRRPPASGNESASDDHREDQGGGHETDSGFCLPSCVLLFHEAIFHHAPEESRISAPSGSDPRAWYIVSFQTISQTPNMPTSPKPDFETRHLQKLERIVAARPQLAYHEASHALYNLHFPLGKPFGVKRVSIRPVVGMRYGKPTMGHDTLGCVEMVKRFDVRRLLNDRDLAEHYLIAAFVGPAGEYRFRGRNQWGRCNELEGDEARHLLLTQHGGLCTMEYTRWLQARAALFTEATFPAIQALAKVLLNRGQLTGKEVRAVWDENKCPLVPESAIHAAYE